MTIFIANITVLYFSSLFYQYLDSSICVITWITATVATIILVILFSCKILLYTKLRIVSIREAWGQSLSPYHSLSSFQRWFPATLSLFLLHISLTHYTQFVVQLNERRSNDWFLEPNILISYYVILFNKRGSHLTATSLSNHLFLVGPLTFFFWANIKRNTKDRIGRREHFVNCKESRR